MYLSTSVVPLHCPLKALPDSARFRSLAQAATRALTVLGLTESFFTVEVCHSTCDVDDRVME